jgi:carbonic anhydrase/acetyltransferase-like protein (isoleucine patch superfamily)
MLRYVIEDLNLVPPFNEPASLLTIGLRPLKIHHEEVFIRVFKQAMETGQTLQSREDVRRVTGQAVVYRDNLWFDDEFLQYFMDRAWNSKRACRAAFYADDPAFRTYVLPLATHFEASRDAAGKAIYLLDLWFFPNGYTDDILPIPVPSDAAELGFYSVPDFMTMEQGDLTHYAPMRAVISIESWVHVYFASVIFGQFGRAARFDRRVKEHNLFSIKLLWRAVLEQKHLLSSSEVIHVGKNTTIHSTAVITGPAYIGDNCDIGPGVFIDNCSIGDNVTIDDGCVLMMSSVANGCFLPFRTALYLTSVMENTIIAQNTCLQMCAIGRNSFVGAGNTFTDFNLLEQKAIRATTLDGKLQEVGQVVLGSAVGHNCRIGSGMVVFPGRMIESDVVLVASPDRRVIARNVSYEESDHHRISGGKQHRRQYPRYDEREQEETW